MASLGNRVSSPLGYQAGPEVVVERLPADAASKLRRRRGIVVMKFGGTSVADPERIRHVASRLVAGQLAGDRVVAVLSAMGATTDELLDLAKQVSRRPDPRELDMLISVGERISCALCALAIHDLGFNAISLTGSQAGIVTDGVHGKAKIADIRADRIHQALDSGQIVLVAGFQGISPGQEITTLGRGGSDMTAVALAAALKAEACEIYTDVEGIFTGDPRVVDGARKLHALSYDEMLEMSASGATVLQLRAVEHARKEHVKVHVRSALTDVAGTWVVEADDRMLERAMISGITHTLTEVLYRVREVSAVDLFTALSHANVNVDTILQTNGEIIFSSVADDHREVLSVLRSLDADWSARDDLGKVSVVGAGMKSHPGVAARTLATLAAENIDPEVLSTSPIKIACHLPRVDVVRAARALHRAFQLDSAAATRSHD